VRVERIESVLSGGVSAICRNHSGKIIKPKIKMQAESLVTDSFAILLEKATLELAKSLTDAGKVTYAKYGIAKEYDENVGTLFDERV